MKKKLLCLLMVLVVLVPCFGVIACADESDYIVSGEGRLPFEDVPENQWYAESAEFCYVNGIIKGQGNAYTFAPNTTLSRATFATMFMRVFTEDAPSETDSHPFYDCQKNAWYNDGVTWAYKNGYMEGVSYNTFRPNNEMTREEVACVVARILNKLGYVPSLYQGGLNDYTDKDDVSSWAKESVDIIISRGIMGSTSTNKLVFSPKMTMTRAQAAKIIMSLRRDFLYPKCEHEIIDASCTEGKKCALCGLLFTLPNGHLCETLSCVEGGVCVTCGEEVAADERLHEYSEMNCTDGEKCKVCGYVRNEAKHTTENGICTRCNQEVFRTRLNRIAYYMTKKGTPDGMDGYGLYYYENSDEGNGVAALLYNEGSQIFKLVYRYTSKDGVCLEFLIDYYKTSDMARLSYNCKFNNRDYASMTRAFFGESKEYGEFWYNGDEEVIDILKDTYTEMNTVCLIYADYFLNELCNESVEAFGFSY